MTTIKPEDRSELLAKARSFLASPQVQHQDINAKRAFLVEKGLNDAEIADLIVCVCIPLHLYYVIIQFSLLNCHPFLQEAIPSYLLRTCLFSFLA